VVHWLELCSARRAWTAVKSALSMAATPAPSFLDVVDEHEDTDDDVDVRKSSFHISMHKGASCFFLGELLDKHVSSDIVDVPESSLDTGDGHEDGELLPEVWLVRCLVRAPSGDGSVRSIRLHTLRSSRSLFPPYQHA
jgi:hypothetical protein